MQRAAGGSGTAACEPGVIKRLITRHYRRFAPALDLAGLAYRGAVVSYDAFDEHNAAVKDEIAAGLGRVLGARGTFELWGAPKEFEADFARWCGRKHAIGVASGTAALQLALMASGVGAGDEVITSAHTFIATALAIHNTGARPVLVDPAAEDLTIRADAVAAAITPRTRAIVPVHMHGHVAEMDAILALAVPKGIVVIEDCAQAHGATFRGQRVPIGTTGCFSFYATKPLGGAGNGGMIVTDDDAIALAADRLRDPEGEDGGILRAGRTPSYLNALDAAVLAARLPRVTAWQDARAGHAAAYAHSLSHLSPVLPAANVGSAWYSFVLRLADRDALRSRLLAAGIETRIEYANSLVRSPTFAGLGWQHEAFPVAMNAADHGLSLPIHAFLRPEHRQRVIAALSGARECRR